jgi:rubredoxin
MWFNQAEVFHLLERYICCICGHIYDPSKGEPGQNIPPGTTFFDLSDDWQCPVCSAGRKNFKKE